MNAAKSIRAAIARRRADAERQLDGIQLEILDEYRATVRVDSGETRDSIANRGLGAPLGDPRAIVNTAEQSEFVERLDNTLKRAALAVGRRHT